MPPAGPPAKISMVTLSHEVYDLRAVVKKLQRDSMEQLELEKETQVRPLLISSSSSL